MSRAVRNYSSRIAVACLAAVILISLAWPAAVEAQTKGSKGVGIVYGKVLKPDGKPLGGVWLMIENLELGMIYRKDVNPIGQFEFVDVYPGTYIFKLSPALYLVKSPAKITVKADEALEVQVQVVRAPESGQNQRNFFPGRNPGWRRPEPPKIIFASLALQAAATPVNPQLSRAPARAPGPSADPNPVAVAAGTQINESQLVGLPLNGRSYNQLATLQGTMADPLGGSAQRGGGSGNLTASGGRSSSNTFLMDGTVIMDTGNQVPRSAAGVQLGTDTVLEVQVNGVQYSAEYGRGSGGVLNSVTRSGSDEFRANLFEYFRNSHLDARNFFDRQLIPGEPRLPPFKRNQFGGTSTGPLIPQRTYWMAGVEVMRDRLTLTDISAVVDPANILDAFTSAAERARGIEPAVQAILPFFPPANERYLGAGIGRNAAQIFLPTSEVFVSTRVDHRLTDRASLFGRYHFDDADSIGSQALPAVFRTHAATRQQYLTVVGSYIFSPRALASARFGYTRPVAGRESIATVEIPRELYFVPGAPSFGVISIPGTSNFGPAPNLPEGDTMNTFQYSGNVILQRGTHNLKLGAEAHRYRWDVFTSTNQGATWTFSSLENFLTLERTLKEQSLAPITPGSTTLAVALPGSDGSKAFRQTLVGFYAQDEYRLRPRLQLSLGMRYELATQIHDRLGRTAYLADPLRDAQLQTGAFVKNNPSLRNLSPRVGFTWAPTTGASTLVSAGFGIYYDQMLEYVVDSRVASPPFYKSVLIQNLNPYGLYPNALAAVAAQVGAQSGSAAQALIADYHDFHTPSALRFNFNVRQQLPGEWRVQAGYVGARGNHLYRAYEINQLPFPVERPDGTVFFPSGTATRNPNFGSINLLASDAQSFYHALQLSVNKSLDRGSSVQSNYTFSKSIDDSSNFNANNEGIQYGPFRHVDRALSDYDIRHRLTASFFYGLPFGGQGTWLKTGPLAHLVGGWRVGGIFSTRTGTPINVRMNVRDAGYLFAARRPNLRPGRVGNAITGISSQCRAGTQQTIDAGTPVGTPDLYYDPCAFEVPSAGTIGNNGRNTMEGPDSFTIDISLQREFLLDSKRRLQFRAEAFNLTNHANFRPSMAGSAIIFMGSSVQPRINPGAGRLVATVTTARQIQFALRLTL